MHETWCFEVSAGRDRVARKERACSKKGRRQHAREPAKSRFGRPRKQRTHGSNRRRKQRERRRETARPPPLREAHNVPLSVSGRACEVEDQPKGTRARPKGSTDRSHRHACVLLREKKWRASLSRSRKKKDANSRKGHATTGGPDQRRDGLGVSQVATTVALQGGSFFGACDRCHLLLQCSPKSVGSNFCQATSSLTILWALQERHLPVDSLRVRHNSGGFACGVCVK